MPRQATASICCFALAILLVLALSLPCPLAARVLTPTAINLDRQWALSQIGAPCAWTFATGSADVTVAVIDTGVDLTHPDLVSRLRDDGYDFIDDDADPRDHDGHGTHVAGIIAATLSEAEGVIGLAPGVRILPIRVLSDDGGSDQAVASGLSYATAKGVQVINLSLGASLLLAASAASPEVVAAMADAEAAGILIVVAAGNNYLPLPNVVALESVNAMVVAASNRADQRSRFSNYGAWISVVAPGEDILSTMPTYPVSLTSTGPRSERMKMHYDLMSGTSMAAPYVAALAALIFSLAPEATAAEVRTVIEQSADAVIYQGAPSNVQRLRQLGAGRIDACAALSFLATGSGMSTAPFVTPTELGAVPTTAHSPIAITTATATAAISPVPTVFAPTLPAVWPEPTTPARIGTRPRPPSPILTPLPTMPTLPINPADQNPQQIAQWFMEALRTGDLTQVRALSAPPELGGQINVDLADFLDATTYFERMGSIQFRAASSTDPNLPVWVSYQLAPLPGRDGRALLASGTLMLVRAHDRWYVRSLHLPGLSL